MSGFLKLEVLRAEQLPTKDWYSSDPYVVVHFSSGSNCQEQQTEHRNNTLAPVWNKVMQFKVSAEYDRLEFTVYDHDLIGEDDFMCDGHLWIGDKTKHAEIEHCDSDDDGTDESAAKKERHRLAKLQKMQQVGVLEQSPAGSNGEAVVILLDKENAFAGKLYVRWIYCYSTIGGLLAARMEEEMEMAKPKPAVEDLNLDVLQGNVKRIKERVSEFLAPVDYIHDVLMWNTPAESLLWLVLMGYVVQHGLLLSSLPLLFTAGMMRNWYIWWRWGPVGPPQVRIVQGEEDTEEESKRGDEWFVTKLKRLAIEFQVLTGEIVEKLDTVHDVLTWKRRKEAAMVTCSLLATSLVLALPYVGTVLAATVALLWPFLCHALLLYLFLINPIYAQFPYLAKYYQIGDLGGLVVGNLEAAFKGIPASLKYLLTRRRAVNHLRKCVSPELLELLDVLDSAQVLGSSSREVRGCLQKIFPVEAKGEGKPPGQQPQHTATVPVYERRIVYEVFTSACVGLPVEFFQRQACDPAADVYHVMRTLPKDESGAFNEQPGYARTLSDMIKRELAARKPGGELRTEKSNGDLEPATLWLPIPVGRGLHMARKRLVNAELEWAKWKKERQRKMKYGDQDTKKPRLTVNVLSCRDLRGRDGNSKRVSGRVTWVKVTVGSTSVVTDKKRHPTAPQFNAQCKFGFDPHGRDAFDPRVTPYMRIEVFEENLKGAFGRVEIDLRKLPRREETTEKYYVLKRRGNEPVGEISLSFFAEAFGSEKVKFDKRVAARLSYDKVLQRMYCEVVAPDRFKVKTSLPPVHPDVERVVGYEHLTAEEYQVPGSPRVTSPRTKLQPSSANGVHGREGSAVQERQFGHFRGLSAHHRIVCPQQPELSALCPPAGAPCTSPPNLQSEVAAVKAQLEELTRQANEDHLLYERLTRELTMAEQEDRHDHTSNGQSTRSEAPERLQVPAPPIPEAIVREPEGASQVPSPPPSSRRPAASPSPPPPSHQKETSMAEVRSECPDQTTAAAAAEEASIGVAIAEAVTQIERRRSVSTPRGVSCDTAGEAVQRARTPRDGGGKALLLEKLGTPRPDSGRMAKPADAAQRVLDQVGRIITESGDSQQVLEDDCGDVEEYQVKGYFCDSCQSQYIQRWRYNSIDDESYDLCERCYRRKVDSGAIHPSRFHVYAIPPHQSGHQSSYVDDVPPYFDSRTGLSMAERSVVQFEASQSYRSLGSSDYLAGDTWAHRTTSSSSVSEWKSRVSATL